ncbi:MAG: ABC transporter permease [Desulfomonile tiedjei]|nr:ABC transporter permease [Desulfomonile tiedjei]
MSANPSSLVNKNVSAMPYHQQLIWGREVFVNLFRQQIKIRYQRSFFGFFWSLLHPIFTLAIYSFVFSVVLRIQMDNYVIYLLTSLMPFSFFMASVSAGTECLVVNASYYTRHYVPKMIFPLVSVSIALFDFVLGYTVLLCAGLFLGFSFSVSQVIVPASLVLLTAFTVGCTLTVSILGVYFADTRHITGILMQILLYGSPVLYPITMVPPQYVDLAKLNPLYFFVSNFNGPLYFHTWPSVGHLLISAALALGMLVIGIAVFRKYERDVVFVV